MAICGAIVPDKQLSGDSHYGSAICSQAFINWAWSAYGFQGSFWDQGFGKEDPCNTSFPLARTLNAIWLLAFSAADYWNDGYGGDILHWATRYTRDQIDSVLALCNDPEGKNAIARWYPAFVTLEHIELYRPFFFQHNVVERAGTLVHESRHAGGKSHNATFPWWSTYGPGKSGADSHWGYEGAWQYHALYLGYFYYYGTRTTQLMKDWARYRANVIIDNAFATHPGFHI